MRTVTFLLQYNTRPRCSLKLKLARYIWREDYSVYLTSLQYFQATGEGLRTVLNFIRLSYNRAPTIITETGLDTSGDGVNDTSRITLYNVSIVNYLDTAYLMNCTNTRYLSCITLFFAPRSGSRSRSSQARTCKHEPELAKDFHTQIRTLFCPELQQIFIGSFLTCS